MLMSKNSQDLPLPPAKESKRGKERKKGGSWGRHFRRGQSSPETGVSCRSCASVHSHLYRPRCQGVSDEPGTSPSEFYLLLFGFIASSYREHIFHVMGLSRGPGAKLRGTESPLPLYNIGHILGFG